MSKIDLNNIPKKLQIDALDIFRQDVSRDLDTGKVSAVIYLLVNRVNELTELVEKMRNRSKPGPKPGSKSKRRRGGGKLTNGT